MTPDRLYAHRSMVDVCFKIIAVVYRGLAYHKVKVAWYLKRGMCPMGIQETITIKRIQLKNYKRVKSV